jgi:hypothetical protein
MKSLVAFFFFSLTLEQLHAQYVKPYEGRDEDSTNQNSEKKNRKFIEASKRKLLLVLNEEDPKRLKEFQKDPDKLSRYRNLISLSNQLMTELVPMYWKQENGQVEFKKISECIALRKSGNTDYFTIDFSSLRNTEDLSTMLAFPNTETARKKGLIKAGEFGKFEISLIEKFGKESFYDFASVCAYPNELDFIISIQQMNKLFLAKYSDPELSNGQYEEMVIAKHPYLKIRTLLIDSAQVSFTKAFTKQDLKENYAYSYKLCGAGDIMKAIKSKDTSYAYLAIVPKLSHGKDNSFNSTAGGGMTEEIKESVSSYTHYLIDAASSEALFFKKNESRFIEKSGWKLDVNHILKLRSLSLGN